jgi:NAD(P)-dependent dehydrogenase (short-subunit alcohol dehydrogenase family)
MELDPAVEPRSRIFDFTGKIAVVTGCGSSGRGWGNGKAISALLARQGAQVVGGDISIEAAQETCETIRSGGGLCEILQLDVTDADSVRLFAEAVASRFGHVDVLVNNVGRSEPGGPVDLTPDIWDQQLAINVTGAYLLCRAFLPMMLNAGAGAIVNVSSVAAMRYIGKPQIGYAAAKAALQQFSRAAGVMYARYGVRVNCVVPGLMDTPLMSYLAQKYAGGRLEDFTARRHAQTPMGHMGSAWDVAYAALFLASDEARYITATELVVDGGFTAWTPQ